MPQSNLRRVPLGPGGLEGTAQPSRHFGGGRAHRRHEIFAVAHARPLFALLARIEFESGMPVPPRCRSS